MAKRFPTGDEPIQDIIARNCKTHERQSRARKQAEWLPIDLPEVDGRPFGVIFFGDPHLDSPNCNWNELMRDVGLASSTKGVYGCNIGDTTDNWAPGLLRVQTESSTSKHDATRLATWFAKESGVDWRLWLLGNHDCKIPDVEVLTRRGWLKFPLVLPTDEVLGYNIEKAASVWQRINEIVRFEVDEPLLKYSTRTMSTVCTANHRFLLNSDAGKRYVEARNLPKQFSIVTSCDRNLPEYPFDDTEIELAAWASTDAHVQKIGGRLSFYQSKQKGIDRLRFLLCWNGIDFSEYVRQRDMTHIDGTALKSVPLPETTFAVRSAGSREYVIKYGIRHERHPEWVAQLSARQFDIYLRAVVDADGSWSSNSGRTATVYGTVESLESLQSMCVQHGWTATLATDNRGDPRLYVNPVENRWVVCEPEVVPYKGDVWCLRTPTGNFMMRHDGKAHFTGNSWNEGAAILGLIADNAFYLADWSAKVEFRAGKQRFRVHASHDFKGSSAFNKTHGLAKAAMFAGGAELYVAGHTHTVASQAFETPAGDFVRLVRASGYKSFDNHAVRNSFTQAQSGASVLAIFNGRCKSGAGRVLTFEHLPTGIQVLKALRGDVDESEVKKTAAKKKRPIKSATKKQAKKLAKKPTKRGRK